MKKNLLISLVSIFITVGCATKKPVFFEKTVNMMEATTEQLHNINTKNESLILYFKNWNIGVNGFDPYIIANYHVDLGCGYYFEKQQGFIDTVEQHTEKYVLRYYGKTGSVRKGDNDDYCSKMKKNVLFDNKFNYQNTHKIFDVLFTPVGIVDNNTVKEWKAEFQMKEFEPVTIKENLSPENDNEKIALPSYLNDKNYIYAYSCSHYSIQQVIDNEIIIKEQYNEIIPSIKDSNKLKNKSALIKDYLRPSENFNFCSYRVKF